MKVSMEFKVEDPATLEFALLIQEIAAMCKKKDIKWIYTIEKDMNDLVKDLSDDTYK